jgi:hypothetical protein
MEVTIKKGVIVNKIEYYTIRVLAAIFGGSIYGYFRGISEVLTIYPQKNGNAQIIKTDDASIDSNK